MVCDYRCRHCCLNHNLLVLHRNLVLVFKQAFHSTQNSMVDFVQTEKLEIQTIYAHNCFISRWPLVLGDVLESPDIFFGILAFLKFHFNFYMDLISIIWQSLTSVDLDFCSCLINCHSGFQILKFFFDFVSTEKRRNWARRTRRNVRRYKQQQLRPPLLPRHQQLADPQQPSPELMAPQVPVVVITRCPVLIKINRPLSDSLRSKDLVSSWGAARWEDY